MLELGGFCLTPGAGFAYVTIVEELVIGTGWGGQETKSLDRRHNKIEIELAGGLWNSGDRGNCFCLRGQPGDNCI